MSKLSEATRLGGITVREDGPQDPAESHLPGGRELAEPAALRVTDPALEVLRDQAIGFLRGEDNPFDGFVAKQLPDQDFGRSHVPEIHTAVLEKVQGAIEKLGRPDYHHRPTLHPTRAVVLRGPRGA